MTDKDGVTKRPNELYDICDKIKDQRISYLLCLDIAQIVLKATNATDEEAEEAINAMQHVFLYSPIDVIYVSAKTLIECNNQKYIDQFKEMLNDYYNGTL